MLQFPNDPGIVNVSHIIKSVSFGPSFPGQINPLDGKTSTRAQFFPPSLLKEIAYGFQALQGLVKWPGGLHSQVIGCAGLHRIVDHTAGTFKYYIKVVPTQYKSGRGVPEPLRHRTTLPLLMIYRKPWKSDPTIQELPEIMPAI